MPTNHAKGMYGQALAEKHLTVHGYTIIERNYRIKSGEIDLVAGRDDFLVFVEVKYRKSLSYGYPHESVTPAKQKKIKRVAEYYLAYCSKQAVNARFDVVEVLEQNGKVTVNHIENAFW